MIIAALPLHTVGFAALALAIVGFFVYRRLMRSGKTRRVFDMTEKTQSTRSIIDDVGRANDQLDKRERSLTGDRNTLDNEIKTIEDFKQK